MVAEGRRIVRACLRRNQPGPYQVQAAIAAVHTDAATAADTDWGQVVALYDHLIALTPTPVVALSRAIALGERDGPAAALDALDLLAEPLDSYHLFHTARADTLDRLGRGEEAAAALDRAIALATNTAELDLLRTRRAALDP
jgi:RNA polymerase sigma-70 factor (ECF subfamily)